jgi:hypothetical protein
MRTKGSTYADVKEAFDQGRILRTHMLRTTWHFVTPGDIRWVLAATSPRVLTVFGSHFRSLGLDEHTQLETSDRVVNALEGGNHLTRKEIGAELERQGVMLGGERLTYIVMGAELRGLICSGPMRGAQHTYAVLDERVPPGLTYEKDEAQTELAARFFKGHGPASLTDFTRWSSLTLTEARNAVQGAARLDSMEVDGQKLWFDPTEPRPTSTPLTAHLLPVYDEAWLTYPKLNFETATGHPRPTDAQLFTSCIIVGVRNVGTWRRTIGKNQLTIETDLAAGLDDRSREAVRAAKDRLRQFLGYPTEQDPKNLSR